MATQPSQNQQKSKAKKLEITDGQRQLLLSAEIDDLDDSSLTDVKDDSVIAVGPRLDTTSTTVSLCVQKRRDIMGYKSYKIGRVSKRCRAFKLVLEKKQSFLVFREPLQDRNSSQRALQRSGKCNDVYCLLRKGRSGPLEDDEKFCIIED